MDRNHSPSSARLRVSPVRRVTSNNRAERAESSRAILTVGHPIDALTKEPCVYRTQHGAGDVDSAAYARHDVVLSGPGYRRAYSATWNVWLYTLHFISSEAPRHTLIRIAPALLRK
jgi:hypothetical protein